jgi:hypothetical protein
MKDAFVTVGVTKASFIASGGVGQVLVAVGGS